MDYLLGQIWITNYISGKILQNEEGTTNLGKKIVGGHYKSRLGLQIGTAQMFLKMKMSCLFL